ncbi:unnamed protein product, partial [marine sediment metagenome]
EPGVGKASAVIAWAGKTKETRKDRRVSGVVGSRLIWHDILDIDTEDIFLSSVAGFLSATGYHELSERLREKIDLGPIALDFLKKEVVERLRAEEVVVCFNGISCIKADELALAKQKYGAQGLAENGHFILRVASQLKGYCPVFLLFDTQGPNKDEIPGWLIRGLTDFKISCDTIKVERVAGDRFLHALNSELAAHAKSIGKVKAPVLPVPDIYLSSSVKELARKLGVDPKKVIEELWRVTRGHPLAMALA